MPYGVSNSFKRGTEKTYARRSGRVFGRGDEPRKRVRMGEEGFVEENVIEAADGDLVGDDESGLRVLDTEEEAGATATGDAVVAQPSSDPATSDDRIFSDTPEEGVCSPPSSPPPTQRSPQQKIHKPAFAFLKRKRSAADGGSEALSEGTPNITRPPPKRAKRMTQMQIDLGGETRLTCQECEMDFIPSNAEDAALHKEFHGISVGGVDMGKGFVHGSGVRLLEERMEDGEVVAVVEGRAGLSVRRKVERCLKVVAKELGAADIDTAELWGGMGKEMRKREQAAEERYKIFLYLAGEKCVGLCLAERIHNASRVVVAPEAGQKAETTARSSAILTEEATTSAMLGFSRIWTCKSHRRRGIAAKLMECVRGEFFYGIDVPKHMVAFSQPSESGGLLAESWFGEKAGWKVYVER